MTRLPATPLLHLAALLLLGFAPGCKSSSSIQVAPPAGQPTARHVDSETGCACDFWEVTEEEGDLYVDALEADFELPSRVGFSTPVDTDTFGGKERKAAKISIAGGGVIPFDSLEAFLDSVPSDVFMDNLNISKAASSGRVPQELVNARFPAFILASNKPKDNDYHVIIGNHPTNPTRLMNVEVSGLPSLPRDNAFTTPENAAKLRAVREFYQLRMEERLPTRRYKRYSPGIPVEVTGSAFWDVSHPPGKVGPIGLRPETSWELHPVTFVRFLSATETEDTSDPNVSKQDILERLDGLEAETVELRELVEQLVN